MKLNITNISFTLCDTPVKIDRIEIEASSQEIKDAVLLEVINNAAEHIEFSEGDEKC